MPLTGEKVMNFYNSNIGVKFQNNQLRSMETLKFISASDVKRILTYELLINKMEEALAKFSDNRVVQPVRSVLPVTAHSGYVICILFEVGQYVKFGLRCDTTQHLHTLILQIVNCCKDLSENTSIVAASSIN